MRRQHILIFTAACGLLGLPLIVLSGILAMPAFWLSGSAAVPPGHGVPSDIHVGRTLLYISIFGVIVGLVLVALSLIGGVIFLLTRGKNQS